jgi:hypothetical protein
MLDKGRSYYVWLVHFRSVCDRIGQFRTQYDTVAYVKTCLTRIGQVRTG